MDRITFGVDFDNTISRAPGLFRSMIQLMKNDGHRVLCVTARRQTDENMADIEGFLVDHCIDIPVFYTSLRSKVDFMKSRGIDVDIWIEDDLKSCLLGM
jgi:hypothetical protein